MRIFVGLAAMLVACSTNGPAPPSLDQPPLADAPLLRTSPWPKFRANLEQTGLGPLPSTPGDGMPWSFQTGKGIFGAPVLGPDDTVYIGSADRTFYALNADGSLKWKLLTGEVIDSAALLDDAGRLYFGSGDAVLRALDPADGTVLWTASADPPSMANGAFISWFEGNVGINTDGQLIAPNDSNTIYGINRDTGAIDWRFPDSNQNWSLAAVDRATGRLYLGNNNLLAAQGDNVLCLAPDGTKVWGAGIKGNVVASPMLTPDGKVLVGAFDGYLHAFDLDGHPLWKFETRDHIYASPSLMPDGSTVVQPSADGTIYGIALDDGHLLWTYDTREAIRSSASVAADGLIYVGGGDGRVYVLNPEGTLRWSMQLIAAERNDLNSSAALGRKGFYIAGEDGNVFGVPYDYCLRPDAASDTRCSAAPTLADGSSLLMNTPFGGALDAAPAATEPNQALAFSLFVRAGGKTTVAQIDATSLQVSVAPPVPLTIDVSGDRHFLTIDPQQPFTPDAGGAITVTVSGSYLVNPMRDGLQSTGGTIGGTFSRALRIPLASTSAAAPALDFPLGGVGPGSAFELFRLALPLPTVLPSFNQIGFDALHYLVTVVEGTPGHVVGWLSGVKLADDQNTTVIDPATQTLIPLEGTYQNGLLTLTNDQGFVVNVDNDNILAKRLRIALHLDGNAQAVYTASVHATAVCADVPVYGPFLELLGFCNPQTDVLNMIGAANARRFLAGSVNVPSGLGTVTYTPAHTSVKATLTGTSLVLAQHSLTILLVDVASGHPIALQYGTVTQRTADGSGNAATVTVPFDHAAIPGAQVRAYLMADGYPAAPAMLTIP